VPQSLANIIIHIVFSTKERRPFLQNPQLRDEVHRFLGGVTKRLECWPIRIGGIADRVHILARQSRSITASDWIKELKRASSLCIKKREPALEAFHWQSGYGAFSVSHSQSARVEDYIARQEEHHRTATFQEELRQLFKRHAVEYDERYIWD